MIMHVEVEVVDQVTVVIIVGELDASTAAVAQQSILPHAESGGKLLLQMSGVSYMSSAALRMLLATYRLITSRGGTVGLVGLSEELRDTMEMTGFLEFFATHDALPDAIAAMSA
jgi:anti-sigma B factor antagonist